MNTAIVLILKSKSVNHNDLSNYQPIAAATVISKIFDYFILLKIFLYLFIADNQHGYKSNHRTDRCIFLIKQAISDYVSYYMIPLYIMFV